MPAASASTFLEDDTARQKRAECKSCKHDPVCEGVWGNYLKRYGWDELVPVR